MHTAVIHYHDAELEAWEQDETWTVRLLNLEARARYLDVALAELLCDPLEAHRAAARLLTKLAHVVEQPEAQASDDAPAQRRTLRPGARHERWSRLLVLAFRVLLFAIVSSTAFMLTTWLTTLR